MFDEGEDDTYRSLRRSFRKRFDALNMGTNRIVDYLLLPSDGIYLIYRLLTERSVPINHKALFLLGVFYLLTPFDLVPEVLMGPLGLLDDIPLTVVVFDLLINRQPSGVVQRSWPGDRSILHRIQRGLQRVNEWVGRGLWRKIKNRLK